MSAMIGLCSNKQIHLLQEKLDERFPTDRIDFTRDLPRTLALRLKHFSSLHYRAARENKERVRNNEYKKYGMVVGGSF